MTENNESHPKYNSFSDAMNAGKKAAEDCARENMPKIKDALAEAVHELAYGIAFGSAFAQEMVDGVVSESVKERFREGAEAGRNAAKARAEKSQTAADQAPTATGPENPPEIGLA